MVTKLRLENIATTPKKLILIINIRFLCSAQAANTQDSCS